jgi:hypothetical protein
MNDRIKELLNRLAKTHRRDWQVFDYEWEALAGTGPVGLIGQHCHRSTEEI